MLLSQVTPGKQTLAEGVGGEAGQDLQRHQTVTTGHTRYAGVTVKANKLNRVILPIAGFISRGQSVSGASPPCQLLCLSSSANGERAAYSVTEETCFLRLQHQILSVALLQQL